MNRPSKRTFAAMLASALVLAGVPALARSAAEARFLSTAEQSETPWRAVAASGSVKARSLAAEPAVWQAVGRGDELSPRTLIETGAKSRATLARNASLLVLDPSSRVELPGDGAGRIETSVVQTQGSVMYKVDSRSTPHFEVVTPFLVAGVKGTSFLVTVNDDYTSIVVESGRVEVTDPGTGDSLMLGPGESVLRQRDELTIEMVRDDRRSRDVRREEKRLDRIRSQNDALLGPLEGESDDGLVTDTQAIDGDKQAHDWADDSMRDGVLGAPNDDLLRDELESVTKELIEELIREEIRDGVIDAPSDDVVIIKLPPVEPTGPGGSGAGTQDPIDINQLP